MFCLWLNSSCIRFRILEGGSLSLSVMSFWLFLFFLKGIGVRWWTRDDGGEKCVTRFLLSPPASPSMRPRLVLFSAAQCATTLSLWGARIPIALVWSPFLPAHPSNIMRTFSCKPIARVCVRLASSLPSWRKRRNSVSRRPAYFPRYY